MLLSLVGNASTRQQIAVVGYEARDAASTQKDEETQQRQWSYEAFNTIHATKIQKIVHSLSFIVHNSAKSRNFVNKTRDYDKQSTYQMD